MAVDGDPALLADAHAAKRRAELAVNRLAGGGVAGQRQRRRHADPFRHRQRLAIDGDVESGLHAIASC